MTTSLVKRIRQNFVLLLPLPVFAVCPHGVGSSALNSLSPVLADDVALNRHVRREKN